MAAVAQEGNLEDSDHAVEAFSVLSAGVQGRAGQRERASGSLGHWKGKHTNGTLVRRGDRRVLVFWNKQVQRGKAYAFHLRKEKVES